MLPRPALFAPQAGRLGISTVVSTDSLRHMLRGFSTQEAAPLLWASTYQAGDALPGDGGAPDGGGAQVGGLPGAQPRQCCRPVAANSGQARFLHLHACAPLLLAAEPSLPVPPRNQPAPALSPPGRH